MAYLMAWFGELAGPRRSGMSSPDPITWPEMQAWSALTARPLAPWEVQVLRALDVLWLDAWRNGRPPERVGSKP